MLKVGKGCESGADGVVTERVWLAVGEGDESVSDVIVMDRLGLMGKKKGNNLTRRNPDGKGVCNG